MGKKDTIFKQVIKHKGYWNFGDLYGFCYDFLKEEGYTIMENSYAEKVGGGGKEILIDWAADKKATDYFKNYILVKWHVTSLKDAEIERDGKKESTNKGDLKITVEARLESDHQNSWEDKPLWRFMRGIYDKYIIKTTTDTYEDRARDPAIKMIGEIKSFLQLSGR